MQSVSPGHHAVIDVGSNSARLEIVRWTGERLVPLHRDRMLTRLGVPGPGGRLDPDAAERAIEAVAAFAEEARRHDVASPRIVATAAVRQAPDGSDFAEAVHAATGLALEVLTPEAEAMAVLRSARHAGIDAAGLAVVDIGGGSSEVIVERSGEVVHVASMPLGAVNLSSRFDQSDVIEPARHDAMRSEIHGALGSMLPASLPAIDTGVGVGGSFTTLARVFGASADGVEGFVLERSMVARLSSRLTGLDADGRVGIDGIDPMRSGIIVAGVTLVELVMEALELDRIVVHDGGVARGILLAACSQG